MGLKFSTVVPPTGLGNAAAHPSHRNARRPRPTILNMPFPDGGNHDQMWKIFSTTLIGWARAQEDPFGTNGKLDQEIDQIWSTLFPGNVLDGVGREVAVTVVHPSGFS